MKKITITLSLVAIMVVSAFAQQLTEKTLVKAFNLNGNDLVVLNIDGDIEVQQWSNKIMRVQIDIAAENVPDATLKSLVTAGRYNLKATETSDGLQIDAPGLKRKVTLRGEELKEHISYVVFVPENVMVNIKNDASASVEVIE